MKDFIKRIAYRKRSQKVAAFYNHWSEKFMTITDTFQGFRTEKIEELHEYTIRAADLRNEDVVLDAGCGVGGPAFYFVRRLNIRIYALSNSAVQTRIIEARKKAEGVENITVVKGDYHRLSSIFQPDFFSKVLFLESLGHSYHPQKALKEAFKVLRTGGALYIRDLYIRKTDAPEVALEVNRLVEKANETFVYNHVTVEKILNLLRIIGFSIQSFGIPNVVPKSIDHEFKKKLGISPPEGIAFAEPFEIKAVKPSV